MFDFNIQIVSFPLQSLDYNIFLVEMLFELLELFLIDEL
jgi:hypothetical protein